MGDVGWSTWEEINRILSPTDAVVENFGWPCYEGNNRQSGYDGANLNVCENLYGQPGADTKPYHAYHHNNKVVATDACPTGSSSIAGLEFEFNSASTYPAEYDDALFFADYSRDCIWVMPKGADGHPAPGQIRPFVEAAANPVNLEMGPDGNLYYVDFDGGTIRRIQYTASPNRPPTAVATATPTTGNPPLTVSFDGTGSSDPDPGDTLTYVWDLDGDGAYDDASSSQPTYTYTAGGTYAASLRVTDSQGVPTPPRSRSATPHPPRPSPHRPPAPPGRSATSSASPDRQPIRRTAPSRRPGSPGSWSCTIARPTAISTWSRTSPACPPARSSLLTTSIRPTWSCA